MDNKIDPKKVMPLWRCNITASNISGTVELILFLDWLSPGAAATQTTAAIAGAGLFSESVKKRDKVGSWKYLAKVRKHQERTGTTST